MKQLKEIHQHETRPKVKRDGKWYYGSKGPFETEAEVNTVIRAIHAPKKGKKQTTKKRKK